MQIENLPAKIYELMTVFGVKILAAIAVYIVGRWVAKMMRRIVDRVMSNRKVDSTITKFAANLAYVFLLTFFIIAALGLPGS